MMDALHARWPVLMSLMHVGLAAAVTLHAVLYKRETASVIAWVGMAWLAPFIGSLAYVGFAINRVKRRVLTESLRAGWLADSSARAGASTCPSRDRATVTAYPPLRGLAMLGERLTARPLRSGNRIDVLESGDEAFPAMIAAVDNACRTVTLLTYIFDNDRAGTAFHDALVRALHRGVSVRVLIDAVGARYTRPTMVTRLHKANVPVAAFRPARGWRRLQYANLRNHRKLLVVDGEVGFTGGLNIREGHWLSLTPAAPVSGLHFRFKGPVVADLQRAFAIDWAFVTGERLTGAAWFALQPACGTVAARGITNGPDEDLNHTAEIVLGALSVATRSVRIVTPYFVPDEVLLRAPRVAAMRGVAVDIVVPAHSNIPVCDWARETLLPDLLESGCRVHLTPLPFDHTKLFVVDGLWALVGSTNWDARSLRLNFEFDIECHDATLAQRLDAQVNARIALARPVQIEVLRTQPLLVRLRNGLARLLSPYL
ncbi:MAG: phospholipase D-like domain-containing protein [Betaproteobacteria bacterium]